MEETIIEKSASHSGSNGPNETPIGDQRGVSTFIHTNETYNLLIGISQTIFTKKQFEYLIKTMQLCHFTDEQWNNLKAILIDHNGFTDDQWKMVFHLLSENRLNDKRFQIFVDMLYTSTQKLVLLLAGGGTGKTFVMCKILKKWPCAMKFAIVRVQWGLVLCTYLKANLSKVFSGHGHQV